VVTATRFDSVNKIVENIYTSTIIVKSLSETIAQEIETYAELLKENGDIYNQTAGLIKAAQLVREHAVERELDV
jgi:hypothetical protein